MEGGSIIISEQGYVVNNLGNFTDTSFLSNFQFYANTLFLLLILGGIINIIRGVWKIVASFGNEEAIQGGEKTIRRVIFGVAILFGGIVGIVLLTLFFGQGNPLTQPLDVTL